MCEITMLFIIIQLKYSPTLHAMQRLSTMHRERKRTQLNFTNLDIIMLRSRLCMYILLIAKHYI